LGVIGLSGNVGYIKNNAITQSIVSSAGIESKSLTIDASSSDNIKSNVSSYSVSGVAGEAAVSKVSTSNQVLAKITGNNVHPGYAKNKMINSLGGGPKKATAPARQPATNTKAKMRFLEH